MSVDIATREIKRTCEMALKAINAESTLSIAKLEHAYRINDEKLKNSLALLPLRMSVEEIEKKLQSLKDLLQKVSEENQSLKANASLRERLQTIELKRFGGEG